MMKIATSTAPVVARALWLAARWSEMVMVDMRLRIGSQARRPEFQQNFLSVVPFVASSEDHAAETKTLIE